MDIIKKPIVTEKLNNLSEKYNRYGFVVSVKANKLEIKKAIEDLYGVTVASVNTLRTSGKNKTRFTKTGVIAGKTQAYKKAFVTLAEGHKIDFYSNI
jgi:large subunit ribosomal protein L23